MKDQNELIPIQTRKISINGIDLPVVEYKGQRVITFRQIDLVHQRPEGTAYRNFKANRERFVEGRHYEKITQKEFLTESIAGDEIRPSLWESFGFGLNVTEGIIIYERGYLLLVKSFGDDLAWEIQERIIDGYFRAQELQQPASTIDALVQSLQATLLSLQEIKRLEQRQAAQDEQLLTHDTQLKRVEAKVDGDSANTDFFLVRGFCKLHGIRDDEAEAARRGKRAASLSKSLGFMIGKVKDQRHGSVNTIHEDVLRQVFSDSLGQTASVAAA
ncbi:MAG: ORF6N domain-containing protein [Deltaproteobacteria bacterium]|nr:ORF6N domain-containing protein [Deltaproteobacteria bacterium]